MMTVAERIKAVRETFGMNRVHFAEALGVSGTIISLMEKGKANVSRKTLKLLEEKFGISPVWITYGMGEMFVRSDVFVESVLNKLQSVTGISARTAEPAAVTGREVSQMLEVIEQREQLRNEAPDRMMRIRNAFGLSQNQLAKRLGYTRAYISAVEKGIQRPSARMAELIEQELGVSANWLLYGVADTVKCA